MKEIIKLEIKNLEKLVISEQEIIKVQKLWADQVMQISNLYEHKLDYERKAYNFIKKFYAYEISNVLFKPTLGSKKQFRYDFEDALSYFIGGSVKEDKGFAIKPWKQIRFGQRKFIILEQIALVMGNYYFLETGQKKEIKVEYTFGYIKNNSGKLLINLHHSSLPYKNDFIN